MGSSFMKIAAWPFGDALFPKKEKVKLPTTVTEPIAKVEDTAAETAGEDARQKNLRKKGFLSTILAGELGTQPTTQKRTLLG